MLRGVRCMLQHRHFTQTHNHFIVHMLAHVNPYKVFTTETGVPTEASENTRREATPSVPPKTARRQTQRDKREREGRKNQQEGETIQGSRTLTLDGGEGEGHRWSSPSPAVP